MFGIFSRSSWLTVFLWLALPILPIFFLGSQMAYSQVKGQFQAYQTIPEITRRSELAGISPGQVIMLRGQIAPASCGNVSASHCQQDPADLLIFQERPANGREVRFQEEFALVFPEFSLQLPDGVVKVSPSLTRERVIQHELHAVASGDITRTGFRPGDTVTVQGEWQPANSTLNDATGITGADKAGLMAEWQGAFQKVAWLRDSLGLFTLLTIILLVLQLRRSRTRLRHEDEEWPTAKTKTAPTA